MKAALPNGADLSPREREVLLWAARGKTVTETALIIGSAPCTIQRQRQSAAVKFDAVNTVQAVAMALASGEFQYEELFPRTPVGAIPSGQSQRRGESPA